jgi:hypothetical protein
MPNSDRTDPVVVAPTPQDTWRTEVALFRYTLILPLLRHDRQRDGSKQLLREAISAQPHAIPHSQRRTVSVPTLRRWEKAYRKGGFDALPGLSGQDRQAPLSPRPRGLTLPVARDPGPRRGPQARAAHPLCPHRGGHLEAGGCQPGSRRAHSPSHSAQATGRPWCHPSATPQTGHCLPPLRAPALWRPVAVRWPRQSQAP